MARETYAFFAMLEAAMQTVIDDAKAAKRIFAEQTYRCQQVHIGL